AKDQRVKISEELHRGIIGRLRILLGNSLKHKKSVTILIDRLDEPWRPHHDIRFLAQLLIGLLQSSADMISDMRHETSRHPSVKLNIVIFLRSDIFHHVQEIALEPDKLPVTYMAWSDREALMHLLDIRLEDALN